MAKLLIGQCPGVTRLTFKDERCLVSRRRPEVPVQRIVNNVDFGPVKPLVERRVTVVEHGIPRLVPFEVLGRNPAPKRGQIGRGFGIDLFIIRDMCVGNYFRGGIIDIPG